MKVLNRVFLQDLDEEHLRQVEAATSQREILEKKVFARVNERLAQSLIDGGGSDDNTSISIEDFKTNGSRNSTSKKRQEDSKKDTFGL